MSRFPKVEAEILEDLRQRGEALPPEGALARQYFWESAAQLQAMGLCVADQIAGVVRPPREALDRIKDLERRMSLIENTVITIGGFGTAERGT